MAVEEEGVERNGKFKTRSVGFYLISLGERERKETHESRLSRATFTA